MMADHAPGDEVDVNACKEVVALCRAMLDEKLSFFEGAVRICSLRAKLALPDADPDLLAFVLIESETDHLPPKRIQHRWSPGALERLQQDFERTETWARSFASEACENLIKRFSEQ
jgi:hypothetical protein